MQTLAEHHADCSKEEEDQKARSTKKAKPNESGGENDVTMEEHILNTGQTEQRRTDKPSYCEDQCPERCLTLEPSTSVTATGPATVVGTEVGSSDLRTKASNGNPVIGGMTDNSNPEKSGMENMADTASVKETEDFGPWMIAHRPQRRKQIPRKVAQNAATKGNDSNRFNALQVEVNEVDLGADVSRDKEVEAGLIQIKNSVKPRVHRNVKQANNRPKINQQPKPNVTKSQKSIVGTAEPMQVIDENKAPESQIVLQERKKREETILKILSEKQNRAWKHYLAERNISDEILHQHVVQRSDEELEKIQKLFQKEKWREVIDVEPPDPMASMSDKEHDGVEHESSNVARKGVVPSLMTC
ncbi:hypothetical protein RIF29_39765 [Crotalaria pallida]|uniref:Uncharacterized protein n=1 Tax=Crotalaria pallida TaxID=3830 RepID=A0AAN9HQ29_CROPI